MTKNGHSKFSLTIFPKMTCINWNGQKWPFQIFSDKTHTNLEWAKKAVPNFFQQFSQKDWYKFGMAKNAHSKFIQTFLVQKDWKKFGMAKIRHFKFIQNCNGM